MVVDNDRSFWIVASLIRIETKFDRGLEGLARFQIIFQICRRFNLFH
jgi:hypothetical protein